MLISELRVGDRDLPAEPGQHRALLSILCLAQALLDQFVDRYVDAADEETGDARNPARVAALPNQMFEPRQISFGDLFIDLLRE